MLQATIWLTNTASEYSALAFVLELEGPAPVSSGSPLPKPSPLTIWSPKLVWVMFKNPLRVQKKTVDIQVLTAATVKVGAFWDTAPCSLVIPDDAGSTNLWNVGLFQRNYTALYPRRLSSSLH
jgi:hypothetical protein